MGILDPGMETFLQVFGVIVIVSALLSIPVVFVMERIETGKWHWQ